MQEIRLQFLLFAFVITNAVLYSSLQPLWEGFDEPFHFGYIQHLANGNGIPDPRTTVISAEIASSIFLAPAAPAVQKNIPPVRTYDEFFSLPLNQRLSIQQQLWSLPTQSRWQSSDFPNYEAQHAPLAYALLAPVERLLAELPLPQRVLLLRLTSAIPGALLLYCAALKLFAALRLPRSFADSAVFCVLACQMTWATIAHVANDWLALPLGVYSLATAIEYCHTPTRRNALYMAVVFSLALLTKAYFLAILPLALAPSAFVKRWKHLGVILGTLLVLAGPWYARNYFRYGSLSVMQETRGGLDIIALVRVATSLNWPELTIKSVRAALWTGNNSFVSFSMTTMTILSLLCALGLLVWIVRGNRDCGAWLVVLYCFAFLAALAYATAIAVLYTRAVVSGPMPWYSQVLVAPLLGLAFLGFSRIGRVGSYCAAGVVLLFGYVIIATYVAKLIPLYGGYTGQATVGSVITLYTRDAERLVTNLNLVALVPATQLFFLVICIVLLTIPIIIMLSWALGCVTAQQNRDLA